METKVIKGSVQTLSKNKLKWLRSLHLKKNRNSERKFLLFGEKIITELIENNPEVIDFLYTSNEEFCQKHDCFYIEERDLKDISGFKSSPEVGAVVHFPEIDPNNRKGNITLYLDGIQDPGNLGTIIRTADWFNVKEIICSMDTVDLFNPKVTQSSMGSVFHVPVKYAELEYELENAPHDVYGATLDGENVYSLNISSDIGIVIGSEGQGIREELFPLLNQKITIPNKGHAESLNAAIATGILLALVASD